MVISSEMISTHPHYRQSFQSLLLPICKDGNPAHFDDVLSILKALSTQEITIVEIMLVNDATTATPERSFSTVRKMKT